ncbi:LysM peptidoglycan-binding domain-containing protein [Desulforhopalus vacuolatus]|uniref:lytic transglycosylase n=1 Tax=Desulforhopalus vacuolatus TaxID=40414 RepID=UPI0019660C09|nr:LysM peptidoglycan-binding domain-containing protein [Desulforhopalus vacuolatus]MBM9519986.1 LysM peptidoglycan-binding domain-containing protein [Desulforhopalus vacuolatus]
MQKCHLLQLICATVLAFPLMLSGCASLKNNATADNVRKVTCHTTSLSAVPSSTGKEDSLEDAESTHDIAEEVEALSQSGNWGPPEGQPTRKMETGEAQEMLYDFPVELNNQVRTYIHLFQTSQRRDFAQKLCRSGRYLEMMEKEFAACGIPTDLAYLSMVESGFNPVARSQANAVGLWQFIASTGRMYNLNVTKWIDERRNVKKSTHAAASYLGDLYRDFGDWHLAVAAYNAGPGKIHRGMRKYGVNNFWPLAATNHLQMETKRYVPKLIATIIIARNPEKYGFSSVKLEKPLNWDTLTVGPSMRMDAVALAAGTSTREIRQLNPELRKQMTPASIASYRIKIPAGTKKVAMSNMKRLHTIATTDFKNHKIKAGDTISSICNRYNINATTLLRVNNLTSSTLIPGQKLRIPYSIFTCKLLPKGSSSAMLAFKDSLILYKIKSGDTVSGIAHKYHVPKELLVQWNGLKSENSIRAGKQLALFIDQTGYSDLSGMKKTGSVTNGSVTIAATQATKYKIARAAQPAGEPLITAGQKKILNPRSQRSQIAMANSAPQLYHVQDGDSLWMICLKFQVSIADLKKWNDLTDNQIQSGRTLRIKRG